MTSGRESPEAEEDVLFSPMRNPVAPGGEMRDERNPDSVLFDIKRVAGDVSEKPAARVGGEAKAKAKPADDESSGLIDVKKVLKETAEDQPARSPVLDHLAPPSPEPANVPQTSDGVGRILIMASIVVLLGVLGLLALKAMG